MTASTLKKNGGRKESSKVSKRNGIHPDLIPFFVSLVNASPKGPQTPNLNSNLKILWLRQVTTEGLAALCGINVTFYTDQELCCLCFSGLLLMGAKIKCYRFTFFCKYDTWVLYYTMLIQ